MDRTTERRNQKQRTHDAIVAAATELARAGRPLAIAEVAAAAKVSTATAYRYFPNPQSLWIEVTSRGTDPMGYESLLANAPDDPATRLDQLVERVATSQLADEALWRAGLRATLDRWFAQQDVPEDERIPVRGNRRIVMTLKALGGLEDELPPDIYRKLTMAVPLVYGLDAMVTTRDTCGLDPEEATQVMRWAAQALVKAALAEAEEVKTR